MANPANPVFATFPVPPPVPRFRVVDEKGFFTPAYVEWNQLMWAAIQGQDGILDILTYLTTLPYPDTAALAGRIEQLEGAALQAESFAAEVRALLEALRKRVAALEQGSL